MEKPIQSSDKDKSLVMGQTQIEQHLTGFSENTHRFCDISAEEM